MSYASNERRSTFRGAQVIAFLYSILFFSLIASGYYLLFQDNVFLAITASVLFSLMAWWSARQIGLSKGGIRAHIPLFILLLLISAVGVFNSLMLNLEGRRIFVETIEDSQGRFDQVSKRAATELAKGGTSSPLARMQRVESLKAALFSEIRNPLNCGQGPEARKILASLGEELADFRPLSNPRVDCSQNAKVIEDYERKIGELVERAPWSNQSIVGVMKDAEQSKRTLDGLAKTSSESFAPRLLGEVSLQLELLNSRYRELVDRLPADDATSGLPKRLDLQSVESLGEWSQLVYLILNRWDKPTTYVYLILAGFADWLMIYLFSMVRLHRIRSGDGDFSGSGFGRGFA